MKTLAALLLVAFAKVASAQIDQVQPDPVLPGKGKFSVGAMTTFTGTTPPPAIIADLTYGVSRKTSIGLLGGTTGTLAAIGLRVNTELFRRNNLRGLFKFNMVYYPERKGTFLFDNTDKDVMAWMLTMGVAELEWKSKRNNRYSFGAGFLETHCVEGMMNFLKGNGEKGNAPFQLMTAIHSAASFPVSKRLTIGPEIIVLMNGLQPVDPKAGKVLPFNPFIHVTWAIGKK